MPSDNGIEPGFIDDLLALETREQQTQFLRDAGLLNADGLDRLLDAAEKSLGGNPGKAHHLAELSADLADNADAPAAVPRSAYMRVRTYNENGEFDEALQMVKIAQDGYMTLGMELEALRTNVGLMVTLLEIGHYQEALDTGWVVLRALDGKSGRCPRPTQEQYDLLAAPVHQNRGWCLEYMGRYDEALDAYAAAEEHYRSLGLTQRIGEISDNRGTLLSHVGRVSEALTAHETATRVFQEAGLTLSHAKALSNMGVAHLRIGNYASSLKVFEHARRSFQSLDALAAQHGILLVNTAEAYLSLNLYSEAIATYREASSLLQNTGIVHLRAEALWGMGSALIARLELQEAEQSLIEAAAMFEQAGNTPLVSGVMLEQASLLETRGEKKAAIETANQAWKLVSGNKWPIQTVYAHLRLADLLLPDVSKAEPHLREARRLADRLSLPQLRYRLHERVGYLRRLQGRDAEAEMLLESAVEEIEHLRGAVTQDAMRASFLHDKTAAFEGLLQLCLSKNSEEGDKRAFAIAEQAKSRSLVDLLTGVAETASSTIVDPEQGIKLRNMQADLNAVYSELLGGSGEAESSMPLSDLRSRAVRLEEQISRLRLRLAASGAATNPFEDTKLENLYDSLPSDVALVAYHVVGEEIMAFVSEGDRVRVLRNLGTMATVRKLLEKLTVQWDRFRAGQVFAGRHMTMLERSARQVLSALYEQLAARLEPLLVEASGGVSGETVARKLVIVPHGPLHQVPFHALFDGERYLVERFELSYAPSATVYALCQERTSTNQDKTLVFGVDDPTIPAATAEARAIAERLPGNEVYVGEAATMETLRSAVTGCGVLHLACHGLFRSDNPMFSALKLHDDWLMAADAMDLDLDGALVTLSACESGRSEVYGGDETVGLTRAFLGAGAATLAVSLWLVQDETTAELMGEWYDRLRDGQSRVASLRAAQLEIKRRHPHPYYWAPFVLIGKR